MDADFAAQRVKMVDGQIRTVDVTSAPLLAALLTVPRERFTPADVRDLAYIDEDIRVADGAHGPRYLMEPASLARLIQLAQVDTQDNVLDIGCATGYSAAVLSRLARSVVGLEADSALADVARSVIPQLGYDNVEVVTGPMNAGYAAKAPYDVILIEGSVDEVPEALLVQLREGGRLVAVEGRGNAGIARLFLKTNGVATGRRAFNAAIKPLPGFERARAFEF
ncbi:protein-L-isoaspartate O-methyltransferase [Mesorhizobium sp. SP-1A]|uniref:protein-L-isoaspartate O-methyltransferase family protein n=1 Tax=Mesorhizobium sp. SP-1A TaxID=3077840 RepID=UPI0028F725D6|nr:protein-L-isoaspartate O-methyltransferase [Mesorhizobium sp. SP-1A]